MFLFFQVTAVSNSHSHCYKADLKENKATMNGAVSTSHKTRWKPTESLIQSVHLQTSNTTDMSVLAEPRILCVSAVCVCFEKRHILPFQKRPWFSVFMRHRGKERKGKKGGCDANSCFVSTHVKQPTWRDGLCTDSTPVTKWALVLLVEFGVLFCPTLTTLWI